MPRSVASLFVVLLLAACSPLAVGQDHGDPPVRAPFKELDTLCVNDWWNRGKSQIVDLRVPRDEVVAFALYTVANDTLKLTAQLYPLYPEESREVTLAIERDGEWQEVATQQVNDLGWSTTFRVDDWDASRDWKYRVSHPGGGSYEGRVRRDPKDKQVIVLAALSCNSNKDRGDREEYVRNINYQDPDLIFFAGDQSYDHKEHTAAWLKFGQQFRETFRNRPCVTIPDDHDIGQPNLWGEGGKKAKRKDGSDGGYYYHPEYVKMVERCQTAHLPDPYDPTPIDQGIGVYYTSLLLGGVDFAIIEDRKFKSGPAGKIPEMGPRPDHINDPAYDRKAIDVEGLELLGKRQLEFLRAWGQTGSPAMRVVLSQTGFAGTAHVHGSDDNRMLADLDSNGWPQTGRNKAIEAIHAAGAVHIAGDQHLATVVQHGIDQYGDGPWSFVVPASVNTIYHRWWRPEGGAAGGNHNPDSPLPWTGDYLDGMGNHITMYAYANPEVRANGAGYGLVRFDKGNHTVTFECWPRTEDVAQPGATQYEGWPLTVKLEGHTGVLIRQE